MDALEWMPWNGRMPWNRMPGNGCPGIGCSGVTPRWVTAIAAGCPARITALAVELLATDRRGDAARDAVTDSRGVARRGGTPRTEPRRW
jgi:hypothetical protein